MFGCKSIQECICCCMLEITDNVSLKFKVIGVNYVVARASKLLSKCKISNGRKCLNLKNMTLHNITDELCIMLFKLLHEQNLLRDTKVLDLMSNKLSCHKDKCLLWSRETVNIERLPLL